MALTTAVGIDGGFTTPTGYGGNYHAWNASFTMIVTRTTGYALAAETYRGGIHGGTFSAQGMPTFGASASQPIPDSTDTLNPTETPGSVTLTLATGCTYGGSALIGTTDISTDQWSNDTTLSQSGNFSGAITQTWAES